MRLITYLEQQLLVRVSVMYGVSAAAATTTTSGVRRQWRLLLLMHCGRRVLGEIEKTPALNRYSSRWVGVQLIISTTQHKQNAHTDRRQEQQRWLIKVHYHIFHIQIDLHNILFDKRSSRSTYELLLLVQLALPSTPSITDIVRGSWKVKRKSR